MAAGGLDVSNLVMCTLLLKHDSETWAITISAQKTHDIGQQEMWLQTMNQITYPEEWQIVEYRVTPL